MRVLDEGVVHTDQLGPNVPLMSNSPTQWIAIQGMMLRARVGSEVMGMSTGGSDVMLAFPAGASPGTRDCIRRARAAGIRVVVHEGQPVT